MNEQKLISLARSGDKAAITELLMEHRNIVGAVVNRLIYEPENRKDVIQSVFMRAIKGISEYNGNCRFSTWLYKLTVNESINYNRKKLRIKKISDAVMFEPLSLSGLPDGFETVYQKEISGIISEALETVPLDQKAVFNLYYICGHSGKDGAEIMKISEDNFFMKLKSARDRVRKYLIKQGWSQ